MVLTGAIALSIAAMLSACAAHRDAAATPPPAPVASSIPADIPRAGTNGYTLPDCVYCPSPQYSPEGLRQKIQGQVVLDVVIGADGRAQQIVVKKSLEPSLDEQAIHMLREVYRFKPSNGPEGKPAAVHMLIDMDFHLY